MYLPRVILLSTRYGQSTRKFKLVTRHTHTSYIKYMFESTFLSLFDHLKFDDTLGFFFVWISIARCSWSTWICRVFRIIFIARSNTFTRFTLPVGDLRVFGFAGIDGSTITLFVAIINYIIIITFIISCVNCSCLSCSSFFSGEFIYTYISICCLTFHHYIICCRLKNIFRFCFFILFPCFRWFHLYNLSITLNSCFFSYYIDNSISIIICCFSIYFELI